MQAVDASRRPTAQEPPPEAAERTSVRRKRRRELTPYFLALPTLIVLAALLGYPMIKMITLSFQELTLRALFSGESPPWVGLDNYTDALTNPFFWKVVLRTIVVAATCVVLSVGLGLALALLMRRVSPWVRIAMTVAMMLVWAMPQLVATQVFAWMVDADWGVVNWMIDRIPGVDFANHSWFADPKQGWSVIIALVVWGALPFLAISLYAGMTQVPKELIEAAVVDGAGAWAVFRNVTLPILWPLLVIVTTLSVIWDMGLFTQAYVMRGTKPEQDYYTLSIYSYVEAFGKSNYSLGSAISIITVLLMVGVLAVYVRQMFKIGEAD
jgi:N,N'-diacetylchitobiose transport system permease protein